MTIVKRLLIRASNTYDDNDGTIIPVNTNKPVSIDSKIGTFLVIVNIKDFDGSKPHQSNSLKNINDSVYLNQTPIDPEHIITTHPNDKRPNLRIDIIFKPKVPIRGSDLLFGNDFTVPVRDYVPTAILSTGLKFFTWLINKTVKGDIYNDKPFLYGLALNSFTNMSILDDNHDILQNILDDKIISDAEEQDETESESASDSNNGGTFGGLLKNPLKLHHKHKQSHSILDRLNHRENLNENTDNSLSIPNNSHDRIKFFTNLDSCQEFTFYNESEKSYFLQFDTDFIKLSNSNYAVSIPTYWNKTFDINVSNFANDKLNNFNWVVKHNGYEGVDHGELGLILNFALLDEEE